MAADIITSSCFRKDGTPWLQLQIFTSDLEQIRCVAGFCGTNREVTSFTIIDTPEILDWLHGGEFVVDSGYITSHNPSMLKGFIASLRKKGCAALGVNTPLSQRDSRHHT